MFLKSTWPQYEMPKYEVITLFSYYKMIHRFNRMFTKQKGLNICMCTAANLVLSNKI